MICVQKKTKFSKTSKNVKKKNALAIEQEDEEHVILFDKAETVDEWISILRNTRKAGVAQEN